MTYHSKAVENQKSVKSVNNKVVDFHIVMDYICMDCTFNAEYSRSMEGIPIFERNER